MAAASQNDAARGRPGGSATLGLCDPRVREDFRRNAALQVQAPRPRGQGRPRVLRRQRIVGRPAAQSVMDAGASRAFEDAADAVIGPGGGAGDDRNVRRGYSSVRETNPPATSATPILASHRARRWPGGGRTGVSTLKATERRRRVQTAPFAGDVQRLYERLLAAVVRARPGRGGARAAVRGSAPGRLGVPAEELL